MKKKHNYFLVIFVSLLLVMPACKEKKQAKEKTPKPVEVQKTTPKVVAALPEPKKINPITTAPKKTEGRKIIVYEGEWLYEISRREYGNSQGWVKIYNANKEIIKNPDIIYPNMELIIPN